MHRFVLAFGLIFIGGMGVWAGAAPSDQASANRGRDILIQRAFNPPIWSKAAVGTAWKEWGLSEKPADFDAKFRDRYGLHVAPYENKGLPMGLREAPGLLGIGKGISNDCMLCHGGSILGQSYIGLGNASLDIQALYQELAAADGYKRGPPFPFSNVRGTSEAGAMAVFLLQFRDADLNVRGVQHFDYRTDLCEDVPAWWLLKKKKSMYHTGSTHARSVRSLMQFAMTPEKTADFFKGLESAFAEIQTFILNVEAPKYPFPVDEKLALRGETIFNNTCASCHGTYGANWTYPNKIVPLERIGTDPSRANGFSLAVRKHYEASWLGQERGPDGNRYEANPETGYQAPPLDGIWATAPYFHNGSAPTVYHVLNSKARLGKFTRSYRTAKDDYDPVKLGWKITTLDRAPDESVPAIERRKVYDTTQPGRGNGGHTFGDKLTEEERWAVVEYLKRL